MGLGFISSLWWIQQIPTEFRCIGRKNINIYINRKYTLHSSPHQRHNSLDVFLYISLQPAVVIESLPYCLTITHIFPSSIFYIEFCSKSTITIRECTIINILLKKTTWDKKDCLSMCLKFFVEESKRIRKRCKQRWQKMTQ